MTNEAKNTKPQHTNSTIVDGIPFLFIYLYLFSHVVFLLPNFLIYPKIKLSNDKDTSFYTYKIETDAITAFIDDNRKPIDFIYFGGNGTNISNFKFMSEILRHDEWNVIYPVYKGYPPSKGVSNEMEIMIQVHALADFIKARNTRVYILGFSLGAAVALYFNKVYGGVERLMLVNSFYSFDRVIRENYWAIWFLRYFITEKYENYRQINFCRDRVLFIVSGEDSIISCKNTFDLHALYKKQHGLSSDRNLEIFLGYDHNNLIHPSNRRFMRFFSRLFKQDDYKFVV